jgi:Lactate racemase N-terminal domain
MQSGKNTIHLRYGSWFRDAHVTYSFPDNWDLKIFSMKDAGIIDISGIRKCLDQPVGSGSLRGLARKGMKVLLVCDDISRPTRTDLALPVIISSLTEAGVSRQDISVLIASGTHAVMTKDEIDLKIGKEIAGQHKVYTHNFSKGNVFIGRTPRGTPVYVNKHVAGSDLVIGVGGIYPHDPAGFGGGAKLILGVCGITSILHFHKKRKGSGAGGDIKNEFRQDLLDAARLARMNFIVNMVVNGDREIIDIVAGDTDLAFSEGVRRARPLLGVPGPDSGTYDLVIADVYPIDSTYAFMRKGWWPVKSVSYNCHKLIIAAMPKGIGGHMIYSVPGEPRINKLKLLYFEFRSFGIAYMAEILSSRLVSKFSRPKSNISKMSPPVSENRDPGKPDNNLTGNKGKLVVLHHPDNEITDQFASLPHQVFDNMDKYIAYVSELTGHKPLRVAIYKNSSLTFLSGD